MTDSRLYGYTPQELVAWQPPKYRYVIDKAVFIDNGSLLIYGEQETWKSMLALHTTFTIASGRDWFGYKVFPRSVYSFQSEIPQLFQRERMIKYMTGNIQTANNLFLCSELYLKIDQGWGFSEIERELKRTGAKVLIIDPIYTSVSINLIEDYQIRQFLDRMNMLRSRYNISLVLIHHTRQAEGVEGTKYHYGPEDIFGGSTFPRWFDTIIYVEKQGEDEDNNTVDLKLRFEKTRNAEGKLKDIELRGFRENLTIMRRDVIDVAELGIMPKM